MPYTAAVGGPTRGCVSPDLSANTPDHSWSQVLCYRTVSSGEAAVEASVVNVVQRLGVSAVEELPLVVVVLVLGLQLLLHQLVALPQRRVLDALDLPGRQQHFIGVSLEGARDYSWSVISPEPVTRTSPWSNPMFSSLPLKRVGNNLKAKQHRVYSQVCGRSLLITSRSGQKTKVKPNFRTCPRLRGFLSSLFWSFLTPTALHL